MKTENLPDRTLNTVEFVILALFAIALPLVEAPKNIFWALFLFIWIGRSIALRNFGHVDRRWDIVFGGVLTAALISVLATPYPPQWREMGDILGYLSLGWMLARSRLTEQQLFQLLWAFTLATVVGLIHGYWFQHIYHKDWLQLNSVGHVNHSAVYGAGIAILSVVLVAAFWKRVVPVHRALIGILSLALLAVMFTWGSRGALLTYLFGAIVFGLYFMRTTKLRLWPVIVVVTAVAAISLAMNPLLIQKTQQNLESGSKTAARAEAAHTATEIWRHHPITGIGAANFSQISPEQVEKWLTQRGEKYARDNFLFSSHAHNLYFNTLAERGLIGVVALLALMACWTIELVRRRPSASSETTHWLCWGAAVSGWSIVFVAGVFNTTLHHEHGMLAMCFLGLLLGSTRKQPVMVSA